ncbi:hypothetical protein ACFPRL_28585 [Pseudoclavibacter helvolus]
MCGVRGRRSRAQLNRGARKVTLVSCTSGGIHMFHYGDSRRRELTRRWWGHVKAAATGARWPYEFG